MYMFIIYFLTITWRTKCITWHPEPCVINPMQRVIMEQCWMHTCVSQTEKRCLLSHVSWWRSSLLALLPGSDVTAVACGRTLVGNMCPLCRGTEDEEMNTDRACCFYRSQPVKQRHGESLKKDAGDGNYKQWWCPKLWELVFSADKNSFKSVISILCPY